MGASSAIYSQAADDYSRWRIRLECQRVGCDAHHTLVWGQFDKWLRHGGDTYQLAEGPYEGSWQGVAGWLDTLHAPLLAAREAERERARLVNLWPLRAVDPLIGG
jgi:hypothetical protein